MDEEIRDSDTLLDPFMASSLENRFEEYAKDFEGSGGNGKNLPSDVHVEQGAAKEVVAEEEKLEKKSEEPKILAPLSEKKLQLEDKPRSSASGSAKEKHKASTQGSFHSQLSTEIDIHQPHDQMIGEFIETRDDAAMGTTRTLLPLETKLICGVQPGSSAILEDIKENRLPPQSPTEEKANLIISSAVKWLSKTSGEEEQKFYLLTNSGEVVDPIANAKRNQDFHELFPQIDSAERLIEDYTCAWLNDVLLHGRMYISESHICFYTKVIWTYTVVLPLSDVASIEKKVFGGLFDNSMEIQSKDGKKYYFTSFLYRNLAFEVLTKVVNGYPSNIIQMTMDVPRRPSFATLSQERRTRSDGSLNDVKSPPRTSSASYRQSEEIRIAKGLADIVDIPRPPSSTGSEADAASKKHVLHQKIQVNAPTQAELKTPPRLIPLPSLPDKPFDCECLDIHKSQRPALDEKISLNLEQVIESLVYSDSKFLRKLWSNMNYTDLQITDWIPAATDLNSPDLFKPVSTYLKFSDLRVGFKRQTQYIRPINNPLGPKTSICIITETIKQISKNQICIESVTKTPGVPSGNAFQVITRYCVLFNNANTTRILATCKIDYIASTWLKIALDKAVPEGVRDYYQALHKELKSFALGTVPGPNKAISKEQSTDKVTIPPESTLQRTNSFEKLNELVEFLQTNNIGMTVITFMAILVVLNIFVLWFMFRLNSKLELAMSQYQQQAHKEL